jgi:GT2 family glycosyltransferase
MGVPRGRNIACRLGRAAIVVALDSDAVFAERQALRTIVDRFAADPTLAAIGVRILDAATRRDDLAAWGYPKAQLPMAGQPFPTTRFVGTAHAYRRVAFDAVGGYDGELFFCWEEVDLCLRLINHGYTILYEPAVAVLHKNSPECRMSWQGKRYYYFARNRIFIELKYRSSLWPAAAIACGYLVKGAINGLTSQALRGCRDALLMAWRRRREPEWRSQVLSAAATRYIDAHERRYRGNLWRRLRTEVLAPLP